MKKTLWALLDDRMGSVGQAKGILQALEGKINIVEKNIVYNKWAKLPNFLRGTSLLGVDKEKSSSLDEGTPDIILSISRRTLPVARNIRKKSKNKAKIVQLMYPGKTGLKDVELIIVSEHDRNKCSGNNFFYITGCPHRMTQERLIEANQKWEKEFFEFFLIEKKQKISPEQQLFWQNLSWKKLSIHNLDVYVFHRPMNAHEIMACFQKNRQYFDASRLFIRKPGYKQEKTIFLNSKSSVDPRFSSPHLSARIIRKNAPVIVLEPGAVQFGPYAKLQKGSYHITIQGENLKALTFSCYSFYALLF